jgi:hypothetical protein
VPARQRLSSSASRAARACAQNSTTLATIYELERLRCNACGEMFTAQARRRRLREVRRDRIEHDRSLEIRLGLASESSRAYSSACLTQWEIVRDAARLYADVYSELAHRGAGGQVLNNDDTTMKVFELEDPKRRIERVRRNRSIEQTHAVGMKSSTRAHGCRNSCDRPGLRA